jgi:hypothetical protein
MWTSGARSQQPDHRQEKEGDRHRDQRQQAQPEKISL